MHIEAYAACERFYDTYLKDLVGGVVKNSVLDVGSYNVNGTLKPLFFEELWDYVGMDNEAGTNVDVVRHTIDFPFADNRFDVAVTTSALEHDSTFWLSIFEMARVVKPGGWVYLCAPSQGAYNAYPIDCYRFFEDAWRAFDGVNGLSLIETWQAGGYYNDSIGVFHKV